MKKNWIIGITLIALVAFAFNSPRSERYFEIAKNLDIFATLFKEVNAYYVDEINPNKVMKDAITGMLKNLDPYTNYIPEDDIEDYRTLTTGQYGGIGAIVGTRNGKNIVIMPSEGYPAHKAGLRIADEIVKIDEVDVSSKNYSAISKLLKGQANTEVEITVKRYGVKDKLVFNLKRARITVDNVPYFGMVDESIGYVRLSDFTTSAGKEVRDAVNKLTEKGAKGIILDLRGNPGGLLSEAVNVSNVFVQKDSPIVSTKGKVTEWNKTYRALNPPTDLNIPLAVLTSSSSASASEIVAGVVQDYDRGVLVGQKTFGKGLVQATRPLTYNSQLKITTAKYYIPSGRCIQAIDYSNRNPDGSVGKLPDSLKVMFKTKGGRTVYDGGGVDPDVTIDAQSLAAITISLLRKNLIFDYATKYHFTHPKISSPKDFHLNKEEFAEFKSWLSSQEYDYTTKVESTIKDLIQYAKKEKYYTEIDVQIHALQNRMGHNKEHDLVAFENQIREMLEEEIVSRYYLADGIIEASFDSDTSVLEAIKVLGDSDRYNKILAGG